MQKSKFDIVVACDMARGIGLNNKLPWQLPTDMKYFRQLTKGADDTHENNVVIMGRNTWDSIPSKRRPLAGRLNIILSRNLDGSSLANSAATPGNMAGTNVATPRLCASFDSALEVGAIHLNKQGQGRCFVIGGAKVYKQAIEHDLCDRLYLTQINSKFDCDVFFPDYQENFSLLSESEVHEENGVSFSFKTFERVAHK